MRIVFDLQCAQSGSATRGIGRYAVNLARSMAAAAQDHDIWILLSGGGSADSIAHVRTLFDDLVPADHIRLFEVPGPVGPLNPNHVWAIRAAERIREHTLDALLPDAVVVGSLFEGGGDEEGVVTSIGELTSGDRTAAVLYDLIPYREPREYLQNREYRVHYARKIDSLLNAGLLLAISDYSRQDAIDLLGVAGDQIVPIGAGADESFHPEEPPAELLAGLGIARPFVFCCPSGFETRKNVERLIAAFAALSPEVRDAHQLVLASHIFEPDRLAMLKLVERAGLSPTDVLFTGHVDDATLRSLYTATALCVVPSLHEGFGLPVLEAMRCGAPVIGSNATSLPEAIGRDDALFDPLSVTSMRDLIERTLTDAEFRRSLIEHAHVQARKFSWEITAQRALTALEERFGTPPTSDRGGRGVVHVPAESTFAALPALLASDPQTVVVLHDLIPENELRNAPAWLNACAGVAVTDERVLLQLQQWYGRQSPRRLRLVGSDADLADFVAATGEAHGAAVHRLIESVGALPELVEQPARFPAVAAAIAGSSPPPFRLRQLLIDVTVLAAHDAQTGVQRVVRAQLAALLRRKQPGVLVEPVGLTDLDRKPTLLYTRVFTSQFLGRAAEPDDVADVRPGDVYYAPDLSHAAVLAAHESGLYRRWQQRGVRVAFLVYDLLPVTRPEFFAKVPNLTTMHRAWLLAVADTADLVLCISQAVADELRGWLRDIGHERAETLSISAAPLGHDLAASKPTTGLPADGAAILEQIAAKPSILMVGTIEPRKGYRQTVAAMDLLWDDGVDANVVIVGRPGWDPDEMDALTTHPEHGKRLIWLSDASDEFLSALYAACTGLLLASEGEGFGLPLVEAAHHRVPLLTRDLPVTREVAGNGATYFSGGSAADLADAIRTWLPRAADGTAPSSELVRRRTWREHADDVIAQLLAETPAP